MGGDLTGRWARIDRRGRKTPLKDVGLGVGTGFAVCRLMLGILAYLIEKSGIVQCAAARVKRNDDGRMVCAPPPGTPLLVSMARGLVEHSGIFLGRNRVAELSGEGFARKVSLSQFLNGDEDDWCNMRMGTRIFAACDDETARPIASKAVAKTAKEFLEQYIDYNLFGNNCHMFTASCIEGELRRKLSIGEWLTDGTFTIDRLNEVIAQRMNGGRKVAWLGVELGEPRRFNYRLTAEKRKRLGK